MATIAELFARDPLKHSEQDIDDIIAHFRANRKQLSAGPAPAAAKALTKAEVSAKSTGVSFDI